MTVRPKLASYGLHHLSLAHCPLAIYTTAWPSPPRPVEAEISTLKSLPSIALRFFASDSQSNSTGQLISPTSPPASILPQPTATTKHTRHSFNTSHLITTTHTTHHTPPTPTTTFNNLLKDIQYHTLSQRVDCTCLPASRRRRLSIPISASSQWTLQRRLAHLNLDPVLHSNRTP